MRKLLLLVLVPTAMCLLGCRPVEALKVSTVPADVAPVDGSAPLAIVPSPPVEDEAIAPGGQLPGGPEAIGKAAPGFTLRSATTQAKVRLLQNKVTVLHFWATWCVPCKKSFADLERLHEKYGERGLVVIGLSVDDEDGGVADFAKREGARFGIAWDANQNIAARYNPMSMPATFIIDRSGIVNSVREGYHDGEVVEIEKAIIPLL